MARAFSGSSQYLERAAALSYPFTVAGWFKTNTTGDQVLWAEESNDTTQQFIVQVATVSRVLRFWAKTGGTGATVDTTAGIATGTWGHMCAVGASATSRTIYLNGGNSATDTVSKSPSTRNEFGLGSLLNGGSRTWYLNGALAEFGVWNVALTADEVVALSKGYSPLLIRPQSLVAYWPLFGNESPEPDRYKNRNDLTVHGATKAADHSRIIQPAGSF